MAATPRIPRISFPGWDTLNKALEQWAEAIERALRPSAVYPLKVYQGSTGPVIRYDAPPVICTGKAYGSIPSGTVDSPGKGSATVYGMLGDSGVTTGLLASGIVRNVTDKQIADTAGMVLGFDGVNYFVLVVDKCSNLS